MNKKIILSGPSLEDILNGNYPKRIKRDAAFALASSCFGKREEVRVNGVHVSILPYKDEETRERFPKAA